MENEKRLIDANELLDFVKRLKFLGGTKTRTQAGQEVLDIHIPQIVAKIRTVDAVEVVRCRDCKFGTHFGDLEDEWINCRNLHGKPLMPFDGFCSYGERKDGDGNG